jgi:hypothetical protein
MIDLISAYFFIRYNRITDQGAGFIADYLTVNSIYLANKNKVFDI